MPDAAFPPSSAPVRRKFADPAWTAGAEPRASVDLEELSTLWLNTGTLCNLECENCYIESSPRNDRLVYITLDEVKSYLSEAEADFGELQGVGYTGREPFMNPEMIESLDETLSAGYKLLVLTNA